MSKTLFTTDWLASKPMFFSRKTGIYSTKINEVLAGCENLSIHSEGLYNYLDFGYSVFGQTPVKEVEFMPPYADLVQEENGTLHVEQHPDPVEQWLDYRLCEMDIIDLVRSKVNAWEDSLPADQEIILPLSGGFDSRLLLWCIRDKSRIRAFTYGLADKQEDSTEVVHGKALAERFGIAWQQIYLGKYHQYLEPWIDEFGISTHAHGMYHFEFYELIRKSIHGAQSFLSGIVGDAWAGSIKQLAIKGVEDLNKLGHTHGLHADPTKSLLSVEFELRSQFYSRFQDIENDLRRQTIETIRNKIILISYLMRVPRLFDLIPWTPFLDIDVAMAMLNLPRTRREGRTWQRDFFEKEGLLLEKMKIPSTRKNTLNHHAMKVVPLVPLSRALLSSIVETDYIDWINRNIQGKYCSNIIRDLLHVRKIGGLLRRCGVRDKQLQAYSAYLCLKPIENLLKNHRVHVSP